MNGKKTAMMCLVALVLAAGPVMAADNVIFNGSDLWVTPADGSTFADFSQEPIPAGFFCSKSAPFTGRITFKGVPLTTSEGPLGKVDTIVQRLDDAVFNKRGVATTRIQMRALLLESIAPVKTACGSFRVKVRLEGAQPITRMRIERRSEDGGRFAAPVAVNVRMSFLPVSGRAHERLEVTRKIRFRPSVIPWSTPTGESRGLEKAGVLLVDTDGDGRPDTYLPGTSNFAAGVGTSGNKCGATWDHQAPAHEHATTSWELMSATSVDC
jgi:hypothetical protein